MAFLILVSGHVVEVAETRTQVVNALAAAGAQAATGTVVGSPMTFRASGILAVAENREQTATILDPPPAVAATPPEPPLPEPPTGA